MVDLHFHVLHGIDDGPDSLSEAVRLVRAAIRTGIVEIVATPHVSWRYDNSSAAIGKALVQLNNALVREALVPDKMRPIRQGAEIAATVAAYFPAVPGAVLAAAYERYKRLGIWGRDPVLPRPGYERLRDGLVSGGLIAEGVDFEVAVDNSLALEVLREG
jgi:hypothetical protein